MWLLSRQAEDAPEALRMGRTLSAGGGTAQRLAAIMPQYSAGMRCASSFTSDTRQHEHKEEYLKC